MATQTLETLEERLTALEEQVKQLQQSKKPDHKELSKQELDKSDDAVPWWQRLVGIYADCPEFEDAVKFGREWRESEEPQDAEAAS